MHVDVYVTWNGSMFVPGCSTISLRHSQHPGLPLTQFSGGWFCGSGVIERGYQV